MQRHAGKGLEPAPVIAPQPRRPTISSVISVRKPPGRAAPLVILAAATKFFPRLHGSECHKPQRLHIALGAAVRFEIEYVADRRPIQRDRGVGSAMGLKLSMCVAGIDEKAGIAAQCKLEGGCHIESGATIEVGRARQQRNVVDVWKHPRCERQRNKGLRWKSRTQQGRGGRGGEPHWQFKGLLTRHHLACAPAPATTGTMTRRRKRRRGKQIERDALGGR